MTASNTLLIRADASTKMGTGHVMRCLALAQAWQETGGNACFILAFHVPALETRLRNEGMQIVHLDVELAGSDEDAAKTAVIAQQQNAQWIVLDGYHFDAKYQQSLKAAGFRLLFIDDYGHAEHYYADVVLNQNIYAKLELYAHREPYTRLLLGTKYALLRREFWEWRDWKRPFAAKARKILVTLGGSDPDNVTLTVIQALQQLPYDDLEAIVLVGGQNPHYRELETAVFQDNRIKLHRNVTNMPKLMAWADLAVSAGGSTNWELAFMNVPTLILILADNQQMLAKGMHQYGDSLFLDNSEIHANNILSSVQQLISLPVRTQTSLQEQKLVGGNGARLTIQQLFTNRVKLRLAELNDSELLWKWANNPLVRAVSFSSDVITWKNHVQWFHQKLNSSTHIFYIALNDQDTPIGQIRYDLHNDDEATISVSIDEKFRNQGYGAVIINDACQKIFTETQIHTIHAYTKITNKASIAAFKKAGFTTASTTMMKNHQSWHLILGKQTASKEIS